MSAFSTYLIGFFVFVIGLALGAYLLNVPTLWIVAGVIVLFGIGILMATSRTKQKDPPASGGGPGPSAGGPRNPGAGY